MVTVDQLLEIIQPFKGQGYEIRFWNDEAQTVYDCFVADSVGVIPPTDDRPGQIVME